MTHRPMSHQADIMSHDIDCENLTRRVDETQFSKYNAKLYGFHKQGLHEQLV